MSNNVLREDILRELFNISVGKSASVLSEIVNKRIILDVPNVVILKSDGGDFEIDNYLPKILEGALMISSIEFKSQLTGEAELIFPAEKMKNFINLCLNNDEYKEDSFSMNFTDIDFDVIKEIGNIVLNSVIGEIGNFLGAKLDFTLPEVKVFNRIEFKKDFHNKEYNYVLMLYITFNIEGQKIEGSIIINLSMNSINDIIKKIDDMEDDLLG